LFQALLEEVKKYLDRSYSPYSNFKVAALLFGKDGIVAGVNVENASIGLTVCAERCAVFKAISEGKRNFEGIFIYSPDGMPYPCGACRQVLKEFFNDHFKVIVSDGKTTATFTLGELLPYTFTLKKQEG